MLKPIEIPGFFVTGTDTGVGKTVIAAAIANWFLRRRFRVGVCKIAATGCPHRREGLVSEDAEYLAHCADTPFPLDIICPQRYAEPLAPAVAAQRADQPLDWAAIQRSLRMICAGSDVIIIEGVGGVMTPMDDSHTILDVAQWLKLPAVVIARPGLGTINHTLLTIAALESSGVSVAGVVINRYPAETPGAAEETNPARSKSGARSRFCASRLMGDSLHRRCRPALSRRSNRWIGKNLPGHLELVISRATVPRYSTGDGKSVRIRRGRAAVRDIFCFRDHWCHCRKVRWEGDRKERPEPEDRPVGYEPDAMCIGPIGFVLAILGRAEGRIAA